MSQKFGSLVELISALGNAFEKEEWEEIAKLDGAAKTVVSNCMSLALDSNDKKNLNDLLVELQSLYDRLSTENMGRRTELAVELKKLNKERSAINQYIQSSGY